MNDRTMRDPRTTQWWLDGPLALLLLATVLGYLWLLPLNLQSPDEARHLDHAQRLLSGEVLYRDVFDITTPGWVYLMTAMFALFGTTLSTARMIAAIIHAGIAIALFASSRQLGVRRALAWTCGFAAVVICQHVFPNASYHWLATLLCSLILLLGLLPPRPGGRALAIGLALGLLIAVHQQRGAALSLGIAAFVFAQWGIARLQGETMPFAGMMRQVLVIAAAAALVVVPILGVSTLMAGIGPVWECLVTATVENYRGALHTFWGNAWNVKGVIITVNQYAPFAVIPIAILTAVLYWQRRDREAARQHLWLLATGLAALLSIAYFPDIVHYTLVVPIFLVMVADLVERLLRTVPRWIGGSLGAVIAGAVLLAVGTYAYQNVRTLRASYSIPYASAFGRIDLSPKFGNVDIGQREVRYYDALRHLVDSSGERLLYVHPRSVYTNLVVGARNPTRFDLVFPPLYTTPAQMQQIIDALVKSRVQYILWSGAANKWDAVADFIRAHYQLYPAPLPAGLVVWQLKPATNGGA